MKRLIIAIMAVCMLGGVSDVSEARYIDNGDGTVTDPWTGLMWQQATAPHRLNLDDAVAYCKNLTLAGYTDWRLPNRDDFNSLRDTSYTPTIHPDYFPDTRLSGYWSSTATAGSASSFWVVNFSYNNGYASTYKILSEYIRAVRGEHSGAFGSLVIHIEPAETRNAGAQWIRSGTRTWFNSGDTESNIKVGSYNVVFKGIAGWKAPDINVTIKPGQTQIVTGTYTAMGVFLNSDWSFVVPKMIYYPNTGTHMEFGVGFNFVGEINGKLMWELDHIDW